MDCYVVYTQKRFPINLQSKQNELFESSSITPIEILRKQTLATMTLTKRLGFVRKTYYYIRVNFEQRLHTKYEL